MAATRPPDAVRPGAVAAPPASGAPPARGADAFAAEFVGTLLLVFFIGMTVSLNSAGGLGVTDFAVIGLVHLLVLAFLVHTLGGASGAHFNPAVTATLAVLRKIGPGDAAVYVVLQLAGAVAGALLVKLLLLDEGAGAGYGSVRVSGPLVQGSVLAGLLAEAIGAFTLMWAIMGVAVDPRGARDWAGLVIGGALAVAVVTLAPISGAAFNPARAIGPNAIAGAFAVLDGRFLVVYVLGPLIGALLAGTVYSAFILGPRGTAGRAPVETLAGEAPRPDAGPRPVDELA